MVLIVVCVLLVLISPALLPFAAVFLLGAWVNSMRNPRPRRTARSKS